MSIDHTEADDDHYRLVAAETLKGYVVPFLGAGANLCGRGKTWEKGKNLPNGSELAELLIGEIYPDKNDRDLPRITQYIESVNGWKPLYRDLRESFAAEYEPTALHLLLADTARMLQDSGKPRQVILTTNYDDALEQAFQAVEVPFDLIWYEARVERPHCGLFMHRIPGKPPKPIVKPNKYAAINPDERTVIVKLHGAMVRDDQRADSYVITEDDYINYLTRADVSLQLPVDVRTRIAESHLLFLGYGMRDWNLRILLQRLAGGGKPGSQSWLVQMEPPTPESAKIDRTLWGDRDVDLMYVALDEYVERLKAKLSSVATAT